MFLTTQTKQILVTGGSGFVAGAYIQKYSTKYKMRYTYFQNEVKFPKAWGCKLNLESEVRMCELFSELRPNVVIHAAAMTNVAECEKDWQKTYDVNVRATHDLNILCQEYGARIIYISTDMVFAGNRGNYEEQDETFPSTRYGKTKRMAEEIVYAGSSSANAVLRLSLVYGFGRPGGPRGFVGWLQDALAGNRPVRLFTDEMRSPVYIEDVVDALDEVVDRDISGIYHIGGRERISRYDFGLKFANTLGYNPACIIPASIHDYMDGPPRPKDLTLNIGRAQKKFKTILAGVDDGLRRMREIQTQSDRDDLQPGTRPESNRDSPISQPGSDPS